MGVPVLDPVLEGVAVIDAVGVCDVLLPEEDVCVGVRVLEPVPDTDIVAVLDAVFVGVPDLDGVPVVVLLRDPVCDGVFDGVLVLVGL